MKINLGKIPENGLLIHEKVVLDKELYQNSSLLDLKEVEVDGTIFYDYDNHLVLNLKVNGSFLLEDAYTLDPVWYPFSCEIDEKIENLAETCKKFYEKSKNILDISEILWENIVLEIPISYTTQEKQEPLKGEGWEMNNGEKQEIDPRLAKLQELLDKESE